jgi:hypothetical protein
MGHSSFTAHSIGSLKLQLADRSGVVVASVPQFSAETIQLACVGVVECLQYVSQPFLDCSDVSDG